MASSKNIHNSQRMLIRRDSPAGFFSNYFFVLEGIILARKSGLQPVIGFPVNNARRIGRRVTATERWSDFFDVSEVCTPHLEAEPYQKIHSRPLGVIAELSIKEVSDVASRGLAIRQLVRDEFQREKEALFGAPEEMTLGVHFRSGDMNWNPGHPTPPSAKQVIDVVSKFLHYHPFKKIFVATDTPAFARKLRKSVALPVLTFPHRRSLNLGWANTDSVKGVLIDAYLLSKCDGLVHSRSNVSLAARVLRADPFVSRIEIDLGLNPPTLVAALVSAVKRKILPSKLRKEFPVLMTDDGNGAP